MVGADEAAMLGKEKLNLGPEEEHEGEK